MMKSVKLNKIKPINNRVSQMNSQANLTNIKKIETVK